MQHLIIAVVLVFAAIAGAAVKICFDIPHKKFKNRTLNTPAKPYEAPLPPPPEVTITHDLKCPVCGYKFAALADNRYTVDGTYNYGRFNYLRDTTIISRDAVVNGKHDAFDCPMCGCQLVVHPRLRTVSSQKRTTTGGATNAPTSEI